MLYRPLQGILNALMGRGIIMMTDNAVNALVALMNNNLSAERLPLLNNHLAVFKTAKQDGGGIYVDTYHRNIEEEVHFLINSKYHAIDGGVWFGMIPQTTHIDFLVKV